MGLEQRESQMQLENQLEKLSVTCYQHLDLHLHIIIPSTLLIHLSRIISFPSSIVFWLYSVLDDLILILILYCMIWF